MERMCPPICESMCTGVHADPRLEAPPSALACPMPERMQMRRRGSSCSSGCDSSARSRRRATRPQRRA
eukprot:3068142-Pleurochrysis_carterae.AAC.1